MYALTKTRFDLQDASLPKRKYYQRTKSGCLTCRHRRIKCDEKVPVCTRCAKLHRSCTWPKSTINRLTSDDYNDSNKSYSTTSMLPVLRAINVYETHVGGPAEIRSFQFFIEEACYTASAYFAHSFWTRTVPQMSWSIRVLKHAAIAFSSLVEKYSTDSDEFMTTTVYLKCWQSAVRGAACLIDEKRAEEILVLCLLLTLCHFMENDLQAGFLHIQSGMQIIAEYFSTPSIRPATLERIGHVGSIFVSIALKAPTYGCELVWPPTFPSSIQCSDELPHIPHKFCSLAHAQHCQSGLLHIILQFRRRSGNQEEIRSLWQKVEAAIQNWYNAQILWENSIDRPCRTKWEPSIMLLKAYANILSIITDDASGITRYESNSNKFRLLVDSMRYICGLADENIAQWFYQQGQLDGHTGYIPPLFFIALKCSDQNIKEEACKLLSSLHVEEGAWTSCVAATIGKKVASIEAQLQRTVRSGTEHQSVTIKGLRKQPASKKWLLDYAVKSNVNFSAIHVSSELELCTCAQKFDLQASSSVIENLGFQGERMSQPSSCATLRRSGIRSDRRQKLLARPIALVEVNSSQQSHVGH